MAKSFWTARRDAALKRDWGRKSASDIAFELGTTRNAVIGRMHRILGTYEAKIRADATAAREKNQRKRAEREDQQRAIISKMEAEIKRGVLRDRAMISARQKGATLAAIGNIFGLSRERVRQIVGMASAA